MKKVIYIDGNWGNIKYTIVYDPIWDGPIEQYIDNPNFRVYTNLDNNEIVPYKNKTV